MTVSEFFIRYTKTAAVNQDGLYVKWHALQNVRAATVTGRLFHSRTGRPSPGAALFEPSLATQFALRLQVQRNVPSLRLSPEMRLASEFSRWRLPAGAPQHNEDEVANMLLQLAMFKPSEEVIRGFCQRLLLELENRYQPMPSSS